jgi:hypothetical protein
MVRNIIENGADEIPEDIEVRIDDKVYGTKFFHIDPIDYLTCDQIAELEKMIEEQK